MGGAAGENVCRANFGNDHANSCKSRAKHWRKKFGKFEMGVGG